MVATDYTLEGAKWGSAENGTAGGVVTWAADSTIPKEALPYITAAFAEWSKVANIQFQEVGSTAESSIDLTNGSIDGAGNVLAVTSYGFSGGQLKNATVEFDTSDGLSGDHLQLVAAHEIGHAIGLGHFNGAPAVMNSAANFSLDGLTQSDIDGITALYGAHTATTPATPPVADNPGTTTPGTTSPGQTAGGAGDPATPGTTTPGTTTPGNTPGNTPGTTTPGNTTPGTTPAAGHGGGCDGTQTAGGDGHGHHGGFHHFGGHDGGMVAQLPADLTAPLQGLHGGGDNAAPAAGVATPVDLAHMMHSHFEHMWG